MKITDGDKLKHRKLHNEGDLQKISAEQKRYADVCASPKIIETEITNTSKQTDELLEKILTRDNLNMAYKQVKKNRGAGGMDGMQVDELLPYLKENRNELIEAIRSGKYKPQPVRRCCPSN